MRLSIERAALLRSLSHVQSIVERRTTIPILSNVKLVADGSGQVDLTATDLDLTLIATEQASVGEAGSTTVSAHTFFDVVRKLPDSAEITLVQAPGASELQLTAGRSRFTLPCLAPDEFPAMDLAQLDVHFSLPPKDLAKLIDKTRFAISTEETRYYLNGIHLHAAGSGADATLRAVATDGHRLARAEVGLPEGARQLPPIIVPRKTVNEVRRLLDEAKDEVRVSVSASRIQFASGRAVLVSRLIDGTFPDYERVIPTGNSKLASLATKPFADAIDRVATISTEKARAVKLAFQAGQVTISAFSTEAGRAVDEIDADYEGEPLEIGFNAKYVLEMLSAVDGPQVRLEMASAAAPTLALDPADSSLLYVLMPMRV